MPSQGRGKKKKEKKRKEKEKKKLHPLEKEGNPSAYLKCTYPIILNCYIAGLNIADFECITFYFIH